MGFGSYDESEQENQEIETDIDEERIGTDDSDHDGDVEFEICASNDELIDRLQNIKEGDGDAS